MTRPPPPEPLLAHFADRCKRCGAGIVWCLETDGALVAVDAECVYGGNVELEASLLGDELRPAFVEPQGNVARYVLHRDTCTPSGEAAPVSAEPVEVVLEFGQHRGKRLDQVPRGYLRWLRDQRAAEIDDASKQQFRRRNEQMIAAINAVLSQKESA